MATSTPSPSGDRVRTLRGRQGLTQADLARKADISPTTIANMETGGRHVRPATVRRVARALGVSPADLFDVDEVAAVPKTETPHERPSELTEGDPSLAEPRILVRSWEVILEDLAARYQEAFADIRDAELNVFPNKVIDVAILVGSNLRLLSREVDEVREAPGVNAAVEKILNVQASVERIIEQKPSPMDDAHTREIVIFNAARDAAASLSGKESEDERLSSFSRAHNAN